MSQVKEVRLVWDRDRGRFARPRKVALAERFLRGPVPYDWLTAAAQLPGQSLAVGIALWHLAGLRGSQNHLALSTERLEPFGVSRHAKDRALRALLASGLVEIERKRGRSPRVSIVCKRRLTSVAGRSKDEPSPNPG
jgi:hypothetical protein